LPELRIDPLSGLKVIVAGERGARPGAWLDVEPRPTVDRESDPFSAGHEDQTPPEVYALREDGGGWKVRVVPNLYPALTSGEATAGEDPLASGRGEPDLFSARPAIGAHEVIVNAPDPVASLAELQPEQVETAMSVWRERMRAHADAAYVHIIVNEGKEAGASLPHTHAQLYALPFVPAAVARERERFTWCRKRYAGGSAWSRSTTRPWRSAPSARGCRSTCRWCRAGPRRDSPTTVRSGRGCCTRR
jgi:UDPglucose--hexose-1-phosphate uridylyltransferase